MYNIIINQINFYTAKHNDTPAYIILSNNLFDCLAQNDSITVYPNGWNFYGIKVLVDSELKDDDFKVVGE